MIARSIAYWGLLLGAATCQAFDEPVEDVRPFGVGMKIRVEGAVETPASGGKAERLDLTVDARLSYSERRLVGQGGDAEAWRSVRDYEVAEASIQVGPQPTQFELPQHLRLIVAQGRESGLEIFSPNGSLSAGELDLLKTPGDSLALLALLPGKELAAGDEWTPPTWAVPIVVGLEAVVKQTTVAKVVSVTAREIRLLVTSDLEGAVVGSGSKIHLDAELTFDREARCLSQATLKQTEKRSVGPISPGLDVTATIVLQRRPLTAAGRLSDAATLDRAAAETTPDLLKVRFDTLWNASMLHDRNWKLFHQTDSNAVLRFLQDGLLVAQCNLAPLPDAAAGQRVSPKDFEADIQHTLGDKFGAIVSREELPRADQRKLSRTIVHGKAGEREMSWIYYLLVDPTGRQISAVISVDRALREQLGNSDLELINGLTFLTVAPRKK